MSFFKKLLAQNDLSEEERTKREADKAEKKRLKEIEMKKLQEKMENEREQKRINKEIQKAEEMKKIERFFGPNPGFGKKGEYSLNRSTFEYLEENVLSQDDKVLGVIKAEYDKTQKREIKGVLVATERLLYFASFKNNSEYLEEFEYSKMNGISLTKDGFASKELIIDYGRGRKKFDDIIDDGSFKEFLAEVRNQIALHRTTVTKTAAKTVRKTQANNSNDKYEQLEKIAKLKDQGILTEEEFNAEKEKILNS
jgi:hypothetical protein